MRELLGHATDQKPLPIEQIEPPGIAACRRAVFIEFLPQSVSAAVQRFHADIVAEQPADDSRGKATSVHGLNSASKL